MPLYEYKCPKCSVRYEYNLALREVDKFKPTCPERSCDKEVMIKQITSHASFNIKGNNSCSTPKRYRS